MEENNVTISLDNDLVAQASVVFKEMGVDINTALNNFLEKLVKKEIGASEIENMEARNKKIPFSELYGKYEGKIWMSDDFDEPMEEMKDYM
jgi:hypothetical protein